MSTNKPARQYSKLINDLRQFQQRNKELEAESLRTAGRIQDALDTALESARTDHAAEIYKLDTDHAAEIYKRLCQVKALREELTLTKEELTLTKASLATTTVQRDTLEQDFFAAQARADDLASKVVHVQPQLALLAEQREDLTHILDTVRDRMRRKELQDEQAILNRQALTGARPEKNWG